MRSGVDESRSAKPEEVPGLRRLVTAYARSVGLAEARLDAVRLAVSEAITNVVLHAYEEQEPGEVHVAARVVGGELWVLVSDDGRGLNATPVRPGLGWGLALITDAADEFSLAERAAGGTEARMIFRLDAPARKER